MAPSDDVSEFQEALQRAEHIIVIAGAGLSAASGEKQRRWMLQNI